MSVVNIFHAKTMLSELIEEIESVTSSRNGGVR